MKVITVSAIIYTICSGYYNDKMCVKAVTNCYQKGLKDEYLNTFTEEHKKARALIGCLQQMGYIK